MKTELVSQLADFIEQRTDLEFDMNHSPTCVKGFFMQMIGRDKYDAFDTEEVGSLLGLKYHVAWMLFYPNAIRKITRQQTAETLRNLVEIGSVNYWPEGVPNDL